MSVASFRRENTRYTTLCTRYASVRLELVRSASETIQIIASLACASGWVFLAAIAVAASGRYPLWVQLPMPHLFAADRGNLRQTSSHPHRK